MFTCISCRVAFESADEQRNHFATDWHRYNMKRRVANLPPVAAASFNDKVLERREQNAVRIDPRDLFCEACSKSFATENAFRSHNQSKKHRERETQYAKLSQRSGEVPRPSPISDAARIQQSDNADAIYEASSSGSSEGDKDEDRDESGDESAIEKRLAASRRKIQPSDCLFCPQRSSSIPDNLQHMSVQHSFFVPDRDHLIDAGALLSYLGEKVFIGNLCLFCPNGGKEFGDIQAVRRHMIDKSHCKMAYETNEDRVEVADYYDFEVEDDGSEWEEIDDEGYTGNDDGVALAPDGLSLQLPSGRTLGHRSLKVYYNQKFRPFTADPRQSAVTLKVQQVRHNLQDPTQALVPVAGGHGAYGRGLQVMKARNPGEAKWAKQQARSFKDQRVREAHKTRVGFVHNSQKHFRDPLLQ